MVLLKNLTQRGQRGTRILGLLFFLLAFRPYSFVHARAGEYELKAAFLYNFTQFVQWPESAFSAPDSPFQLCLIGEDPFGRSLDETVTSEFVGQHPIVVRRIRDVENTPACHLAFVSAKSDITFESVLQTTRNSPVLLVGEDPDSAERGGTIGFRVVDRRIRLTVNLSAARMARLRISSKLLRLSTIVEN
jgi:hypothetical protein